MSERFEPGQWALILGGSSGFGLATAQVLAEHGMNLAVVHRDRRALLPKLEPELEKLRASGVEVRTFNRDALSAEKRSLVLDELTPALGDAGRVRVLLHSIAFGHLKPLVPEEGAKSLDERDVAHTVHSMGTSLFDWVRDVFQRGLFASDARVFGLTSEGNAVAWPGYAAVAAAKAALEALARHVAVEFGPHGIRCNVVQPGITPTPALAAIPGSDALAEHARRRNPLGRLTTPRDVAELIYLLCRDEAAWLNGALVRVDGGESVSGGVS